jgi:type II secretory pathway pseudopilin PulG
MLKSINNLKFLCGMKINFKKGSGLVEILVAVFVFSIVLGSLITASSMYLSGASDNLKSAKGAYLAQEGIEAVKIIRDRSWTNISSLSTSTDYYLYWNTSSSTNNTWSTTTTVSVIDNIFFRTFKVYPVYRNSDGDSTTTPTVNFNLDNHTKKVTVSVSWKSKTATTTKKLSTYIADII